LRQPGGHGLGHGIVALDNVESLAAEDSEALTLVGGDEEQQRQRALAADLAAELEDDGGLGR
jgi:hypothetical protein